MVNVSVYSPLSVPVPLALCRLPPPSPRKVSQKERRRKERRLRSNGIRVRKGVK